MIVDEVKQWGVQCYMRIPGREIKSTAMRLNHSEYYYIGEAEVIQRESYAV